MQDDMQNCLTERGGSSRPIDRLSASTDPPESSGGAARRPSVTSADGESRLPRPDPFQAERQLPGVAVVEEVVQDVARLMQNLVEASIATAAAIDGC